MSATWLQKGGASQRWVIKVRDVVYDKLEGGVAKTGRGSARDASNNVTIQYSGKVPYLNHPFQVR